MKILMVDDSPAILDKMKEILDGSDHVLVTAKDGTCGLGELALGGIDVVIADMNMPRMDGLTMIEFHHKILTEGITRIMFTSEITPELVERGKKIGIDAWLAKPLNKDTILKTLKEVVHKIESKK